MQYQVNAMGKPCPIPVVETKKSAGKNDRWRQRDRIGGQSHRGTESVEDGWSEAAGRRKPAHWHPIIMKWCWL